MVRTKLTQNQSNIDLSNTELILYGNRKFIESCNLSNSIIKDSLFIYCRFINCFVNNTRIINSDLTGTKIYSEQSSLELTLENCCLTNVNVDELLAKSVKILNCFYFTENNTKEFILN